MRVLLDECLPERLRLELPGHQVRTAREAGLAGKKNGVLLELASAQFDVLVTIDQNLAAQQHVAGQTLGIVVFRASSNSFATLEPLLPQLRKALTMIAPGQVIRLGPQETAAGRRSTQVQSRNAMRPLPGRPAA